MEHTTLSCEVSALIFNSKHGMNFNTWISKGVNYLNNKNYINLLQRKKKCQNNNPRFFIEKLQGWTIAILYKKKFLKVSTLRKSMSY